MRSLSKILGAVTVVVVSFFVTLWALDHFWGGPCNEGQRTEIKPPFQKREGFSFYKDKMPFTGDTPAALNRSNLRVCENGKPLGPASAPHDDIFKKGEGRFSHWGDGLFFTTSDNSDPNTNGRAYVVVKP
jgi:hypothetical protein